MKLLRTAILALGAGAIASAQVNLDDLTPLEIAYTTTVSEDLKSFLIEVDVAGISRPSLHLVMPDWTPGAYRIGEYGRNVTDLKVLGDDGAELETTRMDSGSWSIACPGLDHVRATYSVSASRRRWRRPGAEDAPVTGLSVSGPRTYLYVRGAKTLPVTSRYVVPEGWRIANGLLATEDPNTRFARDYDVFIDAPTILGIFEERGFEVNGTPFACVFFDNAQEYDFDLDAFVEVVRKIAANQGQLFGSFPFPNYVFLCSMSGGGGLEHLNSTSIGLSPQRQKEDPEAGASLTSHEFFHAWNVKRIRPATLGPFDYQRENYTGNLWVSEGWTSYFGDLTLVRAGIWTPKEYLSRRESVIAREMNKERRKEHSVFWASRNTWHRFRDEEGSRVDYYGKGELLGALIDLKMRHETDNRKSLNDVMRFLNRWFAERGVGFEEDDIERTCTAISNCDFDEFFARHVQGTLDPPIAEHLAYAGIDYEEEVIDCDFPFDLWGTRIAGRPAPEGEEPEGPRPGEQIRAIDGRDFEGRHEFLRAHSAGDAIVLTLERGEEQREVDVTLVEASILIPSLSFRADPTEKQRLIRDTWLSSVE